MSKSQRTKGAVFEREVAAAFSAAIGVEFKRNIGQARDGGNDVDAGVFVIECKRRKSLKTLEGWLEQAERAARQKGGEYWGSLSSDSEGTVPVAVVRADGGRMRIVVDLADFFALLRLVENAGVRRLARRSV